MKHKFTAGFLALVMVVSTILGQFLPYMTVSAAASTLIIHYGGREDDNYDGWNLWVWEEGKDGKQVDFSADDSYGKIAVCNLSGAGKVGFIVRLNEWEAKDVETDRFVKAKDGVTEIWLTSGKEKVATKAPKGAPSYNVEEQNQARQDVYKNYAALKLNVHFYGFDQKYEGLSAYAHLGKQDGGTYEVRSQDRFGALFQIGFLNEKNAKKAGIEISLPNGSKDCENERTIDLTKAVGNRLDVYLVQGNSKVFYSEEDAVKNPVISKAGFVSAKEIQFTIADIMDTSKEDLVKKFQLKDEEGNSYDLVKVWSENPGKESSASLILQDNVDFSKSYTLCMKNHVSKKVSVSEAFSTDEFTEAFTYEGDDLGATYTKENTAFRVWAPTASKVLINFYEKGSGDNKIESKPMVKDVQGTWVYTAEGDWKDVYYTYSATVDGKTAEAVDPYARTTGVNGKRGMVVDLASTNPEGFEKDEKPAFVNMTDAVIYELQVRDLSSDKSSGIKNKGKFLGLTETGTVNQDEMPTGLDYMKELGITHLHLMPVYDYASVDETKENQYNWGYDPLNYNVPEGSYSTNPEDGNVRVNEYKQMVQTLHKNNIRVVMDVVYNHTYNVDGSNFQKLVPDYYYRKSGDSYSNGSGCGNETATERSMMRKFIVDSVVYWAKEYHIDGFRFDLMGVLDIETMNQVRQALDEIDPSILIYGEGWTGGESSYEESDRVVKANISKVSGVAAFSDDFRDGLKGNVFDEFDTGFISGKDAYNEDIKLGIVGAIAHPQIDTQALTKADSAWAKDPTQCVNYASCHDNLTLWDKIQVSAKDISEEEKIAMNKLAAAMTFTSQGIPFLQAGEEFLRTKPSASEDGTFDANSYSSPDSTNSLKWNTLKKNEDVVSYYKGLIAFRKAHAALRMTSAEDVKANLVFDENVKGNAIAYTITGKSNGEVADTIMVIHNGNKKAITVDLPDNGIWKMYINGEKAGTDVIEKCSEQVQVEKISTVVLVKESTTSNAVNTLNKIDSKVYIGLAILIVIILLLLFISGNTRNGRERRNDRWRKKNVTYYK